MTTRDVGDRVNIRYTVYDAAGALTNATVALAVTDPAGVVTNPSVTNTSTGVYDASFTLATAGLWSWVWTASGAVIDTERGSVLAENPAPPTYASVPDLKSYLGVTDTSEDALLLDCLVTAARGIDHHCGRAFYPMLTASARVFHPRDSCVVVVDDFWTTTGLIVATDDAGAGTYATTWAAADYTVEPLNGRLNGEAWPYYRVLATNRNFTRTNVRPSVQLTAKWGWPSAPGPVRQANIYLAEEAFKMKGSPFGVANFDQFGPIRMRDNPKVMAMLAPYRLNPVLMA